MCIKLSISDLIHLKIVDSSYKPHSIVYANMQLAINNDNDSKNVM